MNVFLFPQVLFQLQILEEAARNVDYKVDATGATDAYLQLKENLGK